MSRSQKLYIFFFNPLFFINVLAQDCYIQPITPLNAAIRCRGYTDCVATCQQSYAFPGSKTTWSISCLNGTWISTETRSNIIPDCLPVCNPPCLNEGLCIAPDQCVCKPNYNGQSCEIYAGQCRGYPPVPFNSRRLCTSRTCTVQCFDNYKLPDGSVSAQLTCIRGEWISDNPDWTQVPACQPECSPSCRNGGYCYAPNKCRCYGRFKGPLCEYACPTEMPPVPINSIVRCSFNGTCVATCRENHYFPGGKTHLTIVCDRSVWITEDGRTIMPNCQPMCNPPCLNNGICTPSNVCLCQEPFTGINCQEENRFCDGFPPTPKNSFKTCNSRRCLIQCAPGFKLPDGTVNTTQICQNGRWEPSNPSWNTVPNCDAE